MIHLWLPAVYPKMGARPTQLLLCGPVVDLYVMFTVYRGALGYLSERVIILGPVLAADDQLITQCTLTHR